MNSINMSSLKTRVPIFMVAAFLIYAVLGIIICTFMQNGTAYYSKFFIPLILWAIATIAVSDGVRKIDKQEIVPKVLAIIGLIAAPICAILFTLIIWEIIPFYEKTTATGLYGYYSLSVPTIAAKTAYSLAYITILGFMGSVTMSIKDKKQKIVSILKVISTTFLACATIVSAINVYFGASTSIFALFGLGGNAQMTVFSNLSWICWICLLAVIIYLSKFGSIDEEKPSKDILEPAPAKNTIPSSTAPADTTPANQTNSQPSPQSSDHQNQELVEQLFS